MGKDKNAWGSWLGSVVSFRHACYPHSMWIKFMPQKITNDSHIRHLHSTTECLDCVLLNMCTQVVPCYLFWVSHLPTDPTSIMKAKTMGRTGTLTSGTGPKPRWSSGQELLINPSLSWSRQGPQSVHGLPDFSYSCTFLPQDNSSGQLFERNIPPAILGSGLEWFVHFYPLLSMETSTWRVG